MKYQVFNHNCVLLGEFMTLKEALTEQDYYTSQTGNEAFVVILSF